MTQETQQDFLWRYMSISKYLHMISTSTLYFANLLELRRNDPFEASLANWEYDRIETLRDDPTVRALSEELAQLSPTSSAVRFLFAMRHEPQVAMKHVTLGSLDDLENGSYYISCWHRSNNKESDAMWKIYAGREAGVAVVTRREKLRNCSKENLEIHVSDVKYEDFSEICEEHISYSEYVNRIIYRKRSEYAYENETRATLYMPTELFTAYGSEAQKGIAVETDLSWLIEKVVISPYASALDINVIESITTKYGFKEKIYPSVLLENPIYYKS